jgi:hypothetical protein
MEICWFFTIIVVFLRKTFPGEKKVVILAIIKPVFDRRIIENFVEMLAKFSTETLKTLCKSF